MLFGLASCSYFGYHSQLEGLGKYEIYSDTKVPFEVCSCSYVGSGVAYRVFELCAESYRTCKFHDQLGCKLAKSAFIQICHRHIFGPKHFSCFTIFLSIHSEVLGKIRFTDHKTCHVVGSGKHFFSLYKPLTIKFCKSLYSFLLDLTLMRCWCSQNCM